MKVAFDLLRVVDVAVGDAVAAPPSYAAPSVPEVSFHVFSFFVCFISLCSLCL